MSINRNLISKADLSGDPSTVRLNCLSVSTDVEVCNEDGIGGTDLTSSEFFVDLTRHLGLEDQPDGCREFTLIVKPRHPATRKYDSGFTRLEEIVEELAASIKSGCTQGMIYWAGRLSPAAADLSSSVLTNVAEQMRYADSLESA